METKDSNDRADIMADDERALLQACFRKEPGAWEQFLVRYNRLIYYSIHRTLLLRNYSAGLDEVEDLFGDVLVHLIKDDCKKLKLFKGYGGATVATWIRTITIRLVIDYLRQKARCGDFVSIENEDVALLISIENPVNRPDEDFEEDEEQRSYSEAICSLGDEDRLFIELYYGRGLSPEQVAAVMGISVKTVYTRVNRLKAKLKEEISKKGRKS